VVYAIANFDKEPRSFLYAFAQSYQTISYFRLELPGTTKAKLLAAIKTLLARCIPAMFGFTVYNSYTQAHAPARFRPPVGRRRWSAAMPWMPRMAGIDNILSEIDKHSRLHRQGIRARFHFIRPIYASDQRLSSTNRTIASSRTSRGKAL
jgi:hypothetical protein